MNYRLIIITLLLVSTCMGNAQEPTRFGIKGGANFTFFSVNEGSFGSSVTNETGFFIGAFSDIALTKQLSFQPEVLYIGLNDFKFLNIPLYAKYKVVKSFNIMVGPSLNYFFDFFSDRLKIGFDLSTVYELTNRFNLNVKFALGINEIAPNGLFLGVGYYL